MRTVKWAGFLAAILYLSLTVAAYVFYPLAYSPLHNWLSDLGNSLVNTKGAILYNTGCIVAALLLMALYVGLNAWRTGNKATGILLSIGQISGIIASSALILMSVLNIGTHPALHGRIGVVHCVAMTWFLSFANTALWRCPGFRRPLGIYGFVTAATVFAYGVFFDRPIGEWIAFGMFICYVVLVSLNSAARAERVNQVSAV